MAGSVLSGCSSAERNHSDTPPSVEEMNQGGEISELAVFSARTALMTKMGLNNRLELMSLVGHDF
ncbi:hypothetical protein XG19_004662 [Salmonella enterica subsp. enterica serovar Gaminara]|nr:hypothetical protein [Salmonella enterica subsp. enterica serovar Schwarzengrund]EDT8855837.1 hypothetical protein [Salmonella enterica subsp. enterica serovar Gaminara]EDV9146875.1 hypothetical protein [Salmonella enterica subsp. enterica serovar Gaminara]EDW0008368.1 hypothetical protein [Salmonella enterica subsp. enterica serovar Gaminara]